jgi:hypothetical protein
VQLFDLPFELARLPTSSECGENQLLGSLAAPPPLHEVKTARDLAQCHRPDIGGRIVRGDEGVDRLC